MCFADVATVRWDIQGNRFRQNGVESGIVVGCRNTKWGKWGIRDCGIGNRVSPNTGNIIIITAIVKKFTN
jgi:hypothetical protein